MSYQCLHRCRVCVILLHPVRSGRSYSIFFFQAEDGIRDLTVTGVQTCALPICDAIAAPLTKSLPGDVWPTVVCDEAGRTLGLVWSTRASLARAVAERRGIYWSRSRQSIWEKGATSGNTQQLLRVDLDCDRDALRFTVRQVGA